MADTDIKLSVDLDVTNAEKTAEQLQKEIEGIFKSKNGQSSASLTSLESQMKQNVTKAQSLRKELDKIAETKIPTAEYKELENETKKLDSQFDKLLIKQDEMQDAGKTSGTAWENLDIKMEQIGTRIRENTAEMQRLVDTGKAFTLGKDSEQYQAKQIALDRVNDRMKQEIIRHREVTTAEEEKARKAEEASQRIDEANNQTSKSNKKVTKTTRKEAKKMGEAFTKHLIPSIKTVKRAISNMNHSLTKGLQPATKSIKKFATRFLMLSLGARSLFALLRKVRTAIVEAFKNLEESGVSKVTEQVKELKGTLATVKNALVAAFEPIVVSILPYLQRMANALTSVIDKLAQFIAVLSGKNTYIRAIKQTGDAVEEAGKKAEGSLASFDKLNVISSSNETENGSKNMFEEAQIEDGIAQAASSVKDKLKSILDSFKSFKKNLKKIIGKIKVGDWLGASADLGDLVNTLLTKLTEKIQNFIPTTAQAKSLGEAIATFLRNAKLMDHIGSAVDILCDVVKAIFTAAFAVIQSFSAEELFAIGQGIMDNILKILDTIIEILNEVPIKELASVAQGILSKSWDVVKKIAEVLKTLFVKAFSLLWTTLTGTELSEGAEKAIGEAAEFALLGIGINKVVKAITGGSGITGLLSAFKKKDNALDRQGKKLGAEQGALSGVKDGVRNLVTNLGPLVAGLGLTTLAIDKLIGSEEDSLVPIDNVTQGFKDQEEQAGKTSIAVSSVKDEVNSLSKIGQNSYIVSGVQAISNVISGIGASAQSSRQEIEELEKSLKNYSTQKDLAGNTQIMPGTSGVTYNPNTGKVNSPASSGTKKETFTPPKTTEKIVSSAGSKSVFPGLTETQIANLLSAYGGSVDLAQNAFNQISELNDKSKLEILKTLSKSSVTGQYDANYAREQLQLFGISASGSKLSSSEVSRLYALRDAANSTATGAGFLSLFDLLNKLKMIPALATGGVIPAGKPFLAMLGDQKSGTNVEAPLTTIEQALRNVMAEQNVNVTFQIEGDPHGMFKVVQKEANNYARSTGRLAF